MPVDTTAERSAPLVAAGLLVGNGGGAGCAEAQAAASPATTITRTRMGFERIIG
jgi:hypothetical protein